MTLTRALSRRYSGRGRATPRGLTGVFTAAWSSAYRLPFGPSMTKVSERRPNPPVEYRDPTGRVWHAAEIAQIRVVAPAIDGPNVCLVIRFELQGAERFAHWIGGEGWRGAKALDRLFAEAKAEGERETDVPQASAESVAQWVQLVTTMGPDQLHSFEERTFSQWDCASLGDLRRAIDRRWEKLVG